VKHTSKTPKAIRILPKVDLYQDSVKNNTMYSPPVATPVSIMAKLKNDEL